MERLLSLGASLVFEQLYAGWKATSLPRQSWYVLLSAIARAPVRQSLAVTGSVNEKIEGFFDICPGLLKVILLAPEVSGCLPTATSSGKVARAGRREIPVPGK